MVILAVVYEKGSMRNVDKDGDGKNDHLQLIIVNRAGSGGIKADLKVFVDDIDVTELASLSIAGNPPLKIKPSMYISSNYGDRVVLEIKHDGKIGPGTHKVKIQATVDWQTFTQEMEDRVL
ncbi:MAG: hypothetical protein ACUVTL_02960 [Thermoproteota archaeon]